MVSGLVSKTLEIVLRELSRAMLGEEAAVHRALLGTPHTLVSKQSNRVTAEQKASFLQLSYRDIIQVSGSHLAVNPGNCNNNHFGKRCSWVSQMSREQPTAFWFYLKSSPQEGKHVLYDKSGQESMFEELKGPIY